MLDLSHDLFEFCLEVLDLLLLVPIFDTFVRDLLLSHNDFFIDGFLELFPLLFELLELVVNLTNFSLQDSHVLTRKFLKFNGYFLLFLD